MVKSPTLLIRLLAVSTENREAVMTKATTLAGDVRGMKSARVELKTNPELKALLREAAAAAGLDLSAFILNAALERAENVLDNQRRRQLSAQSWQQLNQLLAEPAAPTLALQELMQRKNNGSNANGK
ncbi:DUF1778 domain-containing protein [Superficieibacter electus]|uniref:DUF1778 domain-containing protein n=2 Tax=Superficieibacter electus TaxID=2022662 RepID=A0A2P5GM65_9ENTR|nr:DUF1778 domain-containing protein [Superficieibacter electus]POP46616.1 DUF1778 domain-containing protein [Superficieibacter electus]